MKVKALIKYYIKINRYNNFIEFAFLKNRNYNYLFYIEKITHKEAINRVGLYVVDVSGNKLTKSYQRNFVEKE